ncbi:MAG: histidinol-phosphatase HisJ family protein, partial [Abditibacteriota bacterium]|nr:histidinol-phosphatase HisJ family protein [Abditibacteriota bacterium]
MFSYHNHSVFSDGSAALEQMIIAGVNHSLTELGMSDHFSPLPGGRFPEWSMTGDSLDDYFTQLKQLRELYADRITVRLGVETDYFEDGFADVLSVLNRYSPDYVIGSVHFWGDFPIDECADRWVELSQEEADAVTEGYWKKMAALCAAEGIGIVGHLDLCKKFGR